MNRAFAASLLAALTLGSLLAPSSASAAWPTTSTAPGNVAGLSDGYSGSTVTDGAGGAIIVWTDTRNGTSNTDIYAQRFDGAGNTLWGAGVAVCTAAGNQNSPVAVADGFGGVFIAWVDARTSATTGTDIYATRIAPNGTIVTGWTANGTPLCTAAGDQSSVAICTDASANLFAGWSDGRTIATTGTDIAVAKFTSRGVSQWAANGQVICSVTGNQFPPVLAPDQAGGAYFAWSDARTNSTNDVYWRGVSSAGVASGVANGTIAFPHNVSESMSAIGIVAEGTTPVLITESNAGNVATTVIGPAFFASRNILESSMGLGASCASDGATGFYLVVIHNVSLSYQVHADHFEGTGMLDWSVDVASMTTYPYSSGYSFANDGTRGVVFSWTDRRTYGYNAFAQYIDAMGRTLWTPGGVPITWGPYQGRVTGVVADGNGGYIVGYGSTPTNSTTNYAMVKRVDRYGYLVDVAPVMTSVKDVPNDQGGRVSLQWTASPLDAYPGQTVSYYSIWRRVPASAAPALAARASAALDAPQQDGAMRLLARRDAATGTVAYWEQIASTEARTMPGYSFTAATTSDSLPGSNPFTSYMVIAETIFGQQFWPSAPDSGYSVDNLPPLAPAPAAAVYGAGTTAMHWRANGEADLAGYELHRGTNAAFTPTAANLVATIADTTYADAAGQPYVYKLAAIDVHGNVSAFTTLQPVNNVGVDDAAPGTLAFAPPAPSPASSATTLRFTLARTGAVQLEILDASGRAVRTLVAGDVAAGAHTERWDLRDARGQAVPPGLYLARLRTPEGTRVQRVVCVR